MIEHVHDDGGRFAAGFKGSAGDCGTRAIAIATGMPYRDVYELLKQYGAKERMTAKVRARGRSHPRTGMWMHTMRKVMADLGFEWVGTMQIGSGCRVHLREDELPAGRLVVRLSRHYAAVIDGKLHDTYDSSRDGTRCVYGYWRLTG